MAENRDREEIENEQIVNAENLQQEESVVSDSAIWEENSEIEENLTDLPALAEEESQEIVGGAIEKQSELSGVELADSNDGESKSEDISENAPNDSETNEDTDIAVSEENEEASSLITENESENKSEPAEEENLENEEEETQPVEEEESQVVETEESQSVEENVLKSETEEASNSDTNENTTEQSDSSQTKESEKNENETTEVAENLEPSSNEEENPKTSSVADNTKTLNEAENLETSNDNENAEIKSTDSENSDDETIDLTQFISNPTKIGEKTALLKDNGINCPPNDFRARSTGAVFGAGYDPDIMQDNSRSTRTKKLVRIDRMLDDMEEDAPKPKPKWLKITLAVLVSVLSVSALLGIYILYVGAGFSRLYNMKYIEILNDRPSNVAIGVTYEVVSYNMNYGIISSDYTYYKNTGYDSNGKEIKGRSSRAESRDRVEVNTKGTAGLLSTGSNAEAEFFMIQEIDLDSTRTYYVDERAILNDVFVNYAEIFAETGSSNYVFYPLTSPVGKFSSGMVTYSAFDVAYAMRLSMPSDESFPSKYTSADNCISLTRLKVAGLADQRYLCLFNVNISLYDDESIRQQCLERLYELIKQEVDYGNFVIAGGSFSYSLYGDEGVFENKMQTPNWCTGLPDSFNAVKLSEIGCRIIKDDIAIELKTGTTRDASVKYKKGETFEAITDGYIVSNNVVAEKIEVLDNEYLYSSHNPVRLSFYLK